MWPFTRKNKSTHAPAIRCGDICVTWNSHFNEWEFVVGGVAYSLSENPEFNTSLLFELDTVTEWLQQLQAEIDPEIQKHLEGWCEWEGHKELVSIDVSWLIDKRTVDVCYAHDEWGDLGINVVITNGKITDSYAGD